MKINLDPVKVRRGVTLAALAASMPILMAASAQATTASVPLGCTVTAETPVQIGDDFWTHANQVKAIVKVKCPAGGRVVFVDQRVFETPASAVTQRAKKTYTFIFPGAGTQTGLLTDVDVPNTAGTENVVQKVWGSVHSLSNVPGGSFGPITSGSVPVN